MTVIRGPWKHPVEALVGISGEALRYVLIAVDDNEGLAYLTERECNVLVAEGVAFWNGETCEWSETGRKLAHLVRDQSKEAAS